MEQEKTHGFEVYPKRDVTIVRGEGALLWDDRDRQYIDCAAGVGVASVGHGNPDVARAIAEQAQRLVTCPGIFYNDVRGRLMEKLVAISPPALRRVFLCNSGTEAIEAAMKFARHTTGRTGFVSAMRGFHGRTLGALSATHRYRDAFEPLLPDHRFVPFNNADRLEQALDDSIAGVILEIVQGEGGVRPGDRDYFRRARELCDAHGALLIVDEVQTGFARTGRMFACEHVGLEPDLMTLAKAIAGGVPMGAVLCSDRVADALGRHGSTFGGNPLACAAALAAIAYLEEHDLASAAARLGDRFAARLAGHNLPAVREIRHLGLMIGVELRARATPVLAALLARRVLALPAGPTVVRLLPPLVITGAELDQAADILAEELS